jgi:hypothetical protein
MTSELERYRHGAEAGWCRLSSAEKVTAGLRLVELIDEAVSHCSGRQFAGALRAYKSKIENLLAHAERMQQSAEQKER